MNLGIQGRRALVVGASRGIGHAVCKALVSEGAHVAAVARSPEGLATLAQAKPFTMDVGTHAGIDSLWAQVTQSFGAPDIIVWSVAAVHAYSKLHNLDMHAMEGAVVRESVLPARLCQHALPPMMRAHWGRIVFIGSLAARTSAKGAPTYVVTKASLEALARSLAVDYSRFGINSNVVSLGFVNTERLRQRIEKEPERAEKYAAATSIGRLLTPEEAADAIVYLCSERASGTTGSVIDVTGGLHLHNHW